MAGIANSSYSSGDSDDDWSPSKAVKSKKQVRRAIISEDEDSDSDNDSLGELAGATSEEENADGATTDTDTTGIVAASDEEDDVDPDQNQGSVDSDSGITMNKFQKTPPQPVASTTSYRERKSDSLEDEGQRSLNNSSVSETSTLLISESEGDDVQHSPSKREGKQSGGRDSEKPVIEENSRSKHDNSTKKTVAAVTSTPLVKGYKTPFQLDMTAISRPTSDFNEASFNDGDEFPVESPLKAGSSKPKRHSPQASGSGTKGAPLAALNEDVEDMLVAGLNDIALKGKKNFTFNQKTDGGSGPKMVGATCLDFFDEEEEEEDESISANFDFDDDVRKSVGGDSDIQVLPSKTKAAKSPVVVNLDDSDDDGISLLSERMKKLPLGQNAALAKKDEPRKAIFLNEPPPIEKKTYSYDPTNVKHQEFYGDVQRTVSMLAKTIEEMPMPDDEETEDMQLPKGLVSLFDHQRYGLRWLSWREREFPGGGILADEMGLGKTIMVIALIMKSKMDAARVADENWVDTEEVGNCIPSKTTLVVCPVGCIIQWNDEISNKGKGLRVNMYHGPHRTTSAAQLVQNDVVLTTYHTIIHEVPKDGSKTRSPLSRIYWRRIVLDEAHNIRNFKTASALSICLLKARHRWAVTGTPIHNKPADFYSMTKFLRMKPFDDQKVWDFWIGLKTARKSADATARLHTLGKALILRRTKSEVADAGGNVQKIPPKTVEVIELDMSQEEARIYDYLKQFAKSMLQKFMEDREQRTTQLNAAAMTYTAERRKKKTSQADDETPGDIRFSHIFALLVRLRQCAVLPHLIHTMLDDEEIDENVSFDELNDEHIISKINPLFDRMYESTKIKRILFDLEELRQQARAENRPMDKVVIVSQWTYTLEILYDHLRRKRFSSVFITGKEKNTDRADNMKKFNGYPEKYHICLLSLMAGGVGINLVGGNHVFFVEPHWNPQLELQAQDRCHRFGQKKNVTIKRYITKETVESRIMDVQGDKINLAEGLLNSAKRTKGGGLSLPQLRQLFQ